MPKETLSLVESKAFEGKPIPTDYGTAQLVAPLAAGEIDMVIPDGYEATEVRYYMSGSPVRAAWLLERSDWDDHNPRYDITDPHVWHSIVLESFVGGESHYKIDWDTYDMDVSLGQLPTTQGPSKFTTAKFGHAFARFNSTQVKRFVDHDATPPIDNPVRVKLKLGFKGTGTGHLEVGVQVICRRTEEHYAEWRQQVFETLYGAWSKWDRDFKSNQQTATLLGGVSGAERSSSRNKDMIREELKRQVISWLLGEVPFGGRPSVRPRTTDATHPWRQFDVDQVIADAPTVQFFEQAFDWPNMGWICYPYYWAGPDDWLELAEHEAADPEYERFMRAGAARVLLPVRPSFENAVNYWLVYRKPFLGRGLPLPQDKMFVSLATEIRNLTESPVDGGPVQRAWDVKTTTPYVWLEDQTTVPANPNASLGTKVGTEPLHPVAIE
jgi:hypothetical protein